jgi:hypothetical protein
MCTIVLNINNKTSGFIFGGCILLRSLLGLYYSGRQSQLSFLLLSPSTHSLHVSGRVGHHQVNIFCLVASTTPGLWGLSAYIGLGRFHYPQ